MPQQYIRRAVAAMTAYTPGEQPGDPSVLKLNTNENPYPPTPAVAEVLRRADAERLRLYPDPLCRRLREALARRHDCAPEQVFVGNGSDEVLALCTRAFVEPGAGIGWFDPSYSLYPVLARIADAPARPVPLGPGFAWSMPATLDAALFFLTTPNAPTGTAWPREEVEAFCDRFGGVVLLDEAYADFAGGNFLDLARSRPNAIVARTLSKSCSLAGIRLGYAIGPEPLIAAFYKVKDSYNVDRLTQEIALAAVRDAAHLEANVRRIVTTREHTLQALRARGFEVLPSETNFLFVRPAGRTAAELFDALRARGVLVRHFPGPRTGDYLRITIGTDEQMARLLEVLDGI